MKKYKWLAVLLGVLVLMQSLALPVLAAEKIDTEKPVGLEIVYADGETPLTGVRFDLYRIAAVDENGQLTAVKPFSDFNVNIEGKNDTAWRTLAATLEGYILRDDITPTDSGTTSAEGTLSFPNEADSLKQGLYLVMGHKHTQNGYTYETEPFIVMLPVQDAESGEWLYTVSAKPKYTAETDPGESTVTRKVLKIWDDAGYEEQRPKAVVVELLCNGKVYDTVLLSAENNWRYTWEGLSGEYRWTVVEQELENYTVEVHREGITFIVTNTYKEPPTGPSNPPKPTPPPTEPDLPQTGQLWWPVPMLIAAGLLLIVMGVFRRRGNGNEE